MGNRRPIKKVGLHYNWHRHYDPTTGRYTQPDPLGFVDGPDVYSYVQGNSFSGVDPEGRNKLVKYGVKALGWATRQCLVAAIKYGGKPGLQFGRWAVKQLGKIADRNHLTRAG